MVAIHSVGEVAGHPFVVLEYVPGRLQQLARPLPPAQLLAIATGLARGLGATHRSSVLHRYKKAATAILSAGGTVKLLDFGLAELRGQEASAAPGLTRQPAETALEAL